MRIVNICVNAPFTEGYSYQDNLLSEYQSKLGHEVIVVTSTRYRGENGRVVHGKECDYVMKNGVRLIRIESAGKIRSFLGYFPGLDKTINGLSPDFIFIHGLCSMVPMQAIKYKRSRKESHVCIVADNHQDEGTTKTDGFPFRQQLSFFRFMWKRWIPDIERVYGTTSWRKTFAKKCYGIPEEKLDTLIMGIDSDGLPKNFKETRNRIRKDLKIPAESFVFITGGKLDPRKKILEMIEAFHELNNDNARFLVFGSVSDEVKSQFEEYIIKDNRIMYVGYLPSEKVKEYFITADFGVFAGRHSVLWEEAIGCSLPCLFRKYEPVDHVEVEGNCISVPNPDTDRINEIMRRVSEDEKYYNELKEASKKVANHFSYWSIAEKSIECYE